MYTDIPTERIGRYNNNFWSRTCFRRPPYPCCRCPLRARSKAEENFWLAPLGGWCCSNWNGIFFAAPLGTSGGSNRPDDSAIARKMRFAKLEKIAARLLATFAKQAAASFWHAICRRSWSGKHCEGGTKRQIKAGLPHPLLQRVR